MDTQALKILENNRSGYFATIDGDKPRVRPFEFQFEDGGKLWFGTNNKKEVFSQLRKNSAFEFTTTSPEMVWVRISGNAVFSDDMRIKERIMAENNLVRSIYKSADNPVFEVFYIDHGHIIVSDFSGNPPKVSQF